MAEVHPCDWCSFKLESKTKLDSHVKVIHLKSDKFLCTACGKKFAGIEDFMKHVNKYNITTTDSFWEMACAKFRKAPSQAYEHIDFDTISGLVHCIQCSFQSNNLKQCKHHVEMIHLQIPRFICYVCALTFVSKSQLGVHFKDDHQDLPMFNILSKSHEHAYDYPGELNAVGNSEQDARRRNIIKWLEKGPTDETPPAKKTKTWSEPFDTEEIPTQEEEDSMCASPQQSTSKNVSKKSSFNTKLSMINAKSEQGDDIETLDVDIDSEESESGLQCEVCPFTAETVDQMVAHINQEHINVSNKSREKDLDDDLDMDDLESNNDFNFKYVPTKVIIKKEREIFRCTNCPYAASAYNLTARHLSSCNSEHQPSLKTSTDSLPGVQSQMLKCEQCPFQTRYKSSIDRHNRSVHDATRDFTCTNCEVRFSEKRTLSRHISKFTKKLENGHTYMTCVMNNEPPRSLKLKIKKSSYKTNHSNQSQDSDEFESYLYIEPEVCLEESLSKSGFNSSSDEEDATQNKYGNDDFGVKTEPEDITYNSNDPESTDTKRRSSSFKSKQANHGLLKHFKEEPDIYNNFLSEDENKLKIPTDHVDLPIKVYKCITCDTELNSDHDISKHLTAVHNEINLHCGKLKHIKLQPYQCQHCPYKTRRAGRFREHVTRIHLKQKQFLCTKCGKEYSDKRNFLEHDSFKCLETQKVNLAKSSSKFRVLLKPYTHIKRAQDTKLIYCIDCNFESPSISSVLDHVKKDHLISNIFTCNFCEAEFSKMTKVTSHLNRVHNEVCVVKDTVFGCHECSAIPRSMVNLHAHVRGVHFNAWHYQCAECPESFNTKTCLFKHMDKCHNTFPNLPNVEQNNDSNTFQSLPDVEQDIDSTFN